MMTMMMKSVMMEIYSLCTSELCKDGYIKLQLYCVIHYCIKVEADDDEKGDRNDNTS